jgi:DNA-3-methyladenine glycosylase II
MGDFVNNKEAKNDTTISLFDSLEPLEKTPDKLKKIIKIPEFEFYIQDSFHSHSDILIKEHFKAIQTHGHPVVSSNINNAMLHLSSADPILKKLIKKIGTCILNIKPASFEFLVEAILNQQLSKKAADTIVSRVRKLTKKGSLTYAEITEINVSQLKAAGVSERKAEYISDLCAKTRTEELNLDNLNKLTNDEIIAMLTKVKGIGTWTAHMFLIFALCRIDVFPAEDIALKNAIMIQYGLNEKNYDKRIESIVSKWKPYRSIASWYLWATANSNSLKE